ncbi:hypothetical protein [Streptomyces sp. NBC_01314]|uniref:hypothetical protein n=1 Tax=Streptomyces sp. NBC_01314 TaxID=2903821 RepID=UPI00308EF38E|nr:hypothetical protein OG622_11490 [Streptomyces sp. NBC_01314]
MLQKARGVAMGLALILAPAGCSDDGDSGGGDGGGAGGGAADAPFAPSQPAQAIPSKLVAPKGWKGMEPSVRDGAEARKFCEQAAQWGCAGLTAFATTRYLMLESGGETDADFTLLAYDSVESAKAGMKTMVAENHEGDPGTIKPLTIDVGADETDAYAKDGKFTVAALRVGTVVALVIGESLPKEHDLRSFATTQVQRITTAATGKNPDA